MISIIATGLKVSRKGVLDLTPEAVCKNAVGMLERASAPLGSIVSTSLPMIFLLIGIHSYMVKGRGVFEFLAACVLGRVTIPRDHHLHRQVIAWMTSQKRFVDSRSLTVSTVAAGRVPSQTCSSLTYLPDIGSAWFQWEGNWLRFDREKPPIQVRDTDTTSHRRMVDPDITISCLSLYGNTKPVKKFLEHIANSNKAEAMTTIVRMNSQIANVDEDEYCDWDWNQTVARPARKLDTITMDADSKAAIIDDIETYLSPSGMAWYNQRGIPYKRGLLFYGPPGTGKTSFSAALAGHFQLVLYVISFSNPNLNDQRLEKLFESLPIRCIVLLEDVDSAGIHREQIVSSSTGNSKSKSKSKIKDKDKDPSPRGVTLSGLLNAIDGPTSADGRILILTSNSPNSLDPALVRPGRVDLKILFGNASKDVIKQLFVQIYTNVNGEALEGVEDHETLPQLSEAFASKIPANRLSPAEIQGFLLSCRQDPRKAIDLAGDWAKGIVANKVAGCNVAKFKDQIDTETVG
jgi:chaperone BCS1